MLREVSRLGDDPLAPPAQQVRATRFLDSIFRFVFLSISIRERLGFVVTPVLTLMMKIPPTILS